MFKFTIKVMSKNGDLRKSFGFDTRTQFADKINSLIADGATLNVKTEYSATFTA